MSATFFNLTAIQAIRILGEIVQDGMTSGQFDKLLELTDMTREELDCALERTSSLWDDIKENLANEYDAEDMAAWLVEVMQAELK